jgi:hypothetical protein
MLTAERFVRLSFCLNLVDQGDSPNRYLAGFSEEEGKLPLQPEQLLLPAHQNGTDRFRLSRDPLQRLPGSNHARVQL